MADTPLKKARLKRGLTQTEIADALGMHQSAYSRIENGDPTSAGMAEKISRFFDGKISETEILYASRFTK